MGNHSLLQRSSWPRYWTQVSCLGRQILYCPNHQGSPQVLLLRVNGHLSNKPPSCWKILGDMLADLRTLWFSIALTLERKLLEQSKYKIDSPCQALSWTPVEVKIRQSSFWLYRRRSFPPGWVLWTRCAWLLYAFQCSQVFDFISVWITQPWMFVLFGFGSELLVPVLVSWATRNFKCFLKYCLRTARFYASNFIMVKSCFLNAAPAVVEVV